jgi:hypothetical protein
MTFSVKSAVAVSIRSTHTRERRETKKKATEANSNEPLLLLKLLKKLETSSTTTKKHESIYSILVVLGGRGIRSTGTKIIGGHFPSRTTR